MMAHLQDYLLVLVAVIFSFIHVHGADPTTSPTPSPTYGSTHICTETTETIYCGGLDGCSGMTIYCPSNSVTESLVVTCEARRDEFTKADCEQLKIYSAKPLQMTCDEQSCFWTKIHVGTIPDSVWADHLDSLDESDRDAIEAENMEWQADPGTTFDLVSNAGMAQSFINCYGDDLASCEVEAVGDNYYGLGWVGITCIDVGVCSLDCSAHRDTYNDCAFVTMNCQGTDACMCTGDGCSHVPINSPAPTSAPSPSGMTVPTHICSETNERIVCNDENDCKGLQIYCPSNSITESLVVLCWVGSGFDNPVTHCEDVQIYSAKKLRVNCGWVQCERMDIHVGTITDAVWEDHLYSLDENDRNYLEAQNMQWQADPGTTFDMYGRWSYAFKTSSVSCYGSNLTQCSFDANHGSSNPFFDSDINCLGVDTPGACTIDCFDSTYNGCYDVTMNCKSISNACECTGGNCREPYFKMITGDPPTSSPTAAGQAYVGQSSDNEDDTVAGWVVALIVFGENLAVVCVVALVFWYCRRKKKESGDEDEIKMSQIVADPYIDGTGKDKEKKLVEIGIAPSAADTLEESGTTTGDEN